VEQSKEMIYLMLEYFQKDNNNK